MEGFPVAEWPDVTNAQHRGIHISIIGIEAFNNRHRYTSAGLGAESLPVKIRQHFFAQKHLLPI